MKKNKIYVVMTLQQTIRACIHNFKYDSELVWEDGMIGVAPIFNSKSAAEKAYPGYPVKEMLSRPVEVK